MLTPKQLRDRFIERDNKAIEELDYGPITESRILAFADGRLKDICSVVLALCTYLDEKENGTN